MGVSGNGSAAAGSGGVNGGDMAWWWFGRSRLKSEHQHQHCFLSPALVFFLAAFLLLASIGCLYAWLVFTPFVRTPYTVSSLSPGCQGDDEGSWSIGVFYGDSPFNLKPIEDRDVWKDENAAWPVANPVITCASVSEAGYLGNFVADPFIYIQDDTIYLFFEIKNPVTMQGDIGVAKSTDKGATWEQLGIALDEDWHLSYPNVFDYSGQIYMLPECSDKGDLRLYRAVNFPLQWTLEKVLIKKPLTDASIIKHGNKYWMFASDHSGFGAIKNGQLEIWHSDSPLGPWKPHKKNPIHNFDHSFGARNGGRPFIYNNYVYRVGQDCGQTYGKKIRVFRVDILTEEDYKEVEVPLGLQESKKGRNSWNGVRYHHIDVKQLSSGEWFGVIDGDHVPSGDSFDRFVLGCSSLFGVIALVVLLGMLLGAVTCFVPPNWCPHNLRKRSDALIVWEGSSSSLSSKLWQFCTRLNRVPTSLRGWIKPNTWIGRLVIFSIFISGVALMCNGVTYIYGGNGAEEPYPLNGQYSQFTLLTMTYEARLWNLKMFVRHYSRCSSVREIVVVWNKGMPPDLSEFDSAVPVRIRVEEANTLNNRFKIDPLIKTRAVMELDDDIMMTCNDVERGFKVWREHPDRIVGFYPRLVDKYPLEYRAERYARKKKGYNIILTGAAFMDTKFAFEKYWSEEAKEGRMIVDKLFNCEDVLLNYLYANSSSSPTVEYVRPAWAIDTSKFSGAAISRNTNVHYQKRSECLAKFAELYGSLVNRKSKFNQRDDGWDV